MSIVFETESKTNLVYILAHFLILDRTVAALHLSKTALPIRRSSTQPEVLQDKASKDFIDTRFILEAANANAYFLNLLSPGYVKQDSAFPSAPLRFFPS